MAKKKSKAAAKPVKTKSITVRSGKKQVVKNAKAAAASESAVAAETEGDNDADQ